MGTCRLDEGILTGGAEVIRKLALADGCLNRLAFVLFTDDEGQMH